MPQSSPNPFGDFPNQPAGQEEVVKAELVPEGKADPGERISILYLMVWTACTAVILAFYRQAMAVPTSPPIPAWVQVLPALISSPIQGACVASLLLLIWRKVRGGPAFPRQPGHWLLVVPGALAVISWPSWLFVQPYLQLGPHIYLLFYRLPLLVLFFALVISAVNSMEAEPRWRAMFIVWLAANLIGPVTTCIGGYGFGTIAVEPIIGVVVGLAFLVPMIQDRRLGVQRDQLHYAGVMARIAQVGMTVIQLVTMFLPR
jgi:hypothetical protein